MIKNSRYGQFRHSDYCVSYLGMAVLLLFSVASIIVDLSWIFIAFPIVLVVFWLLSILMPHRERFIVDHDTITIFRGKNTYTITLPSELILVISYADIAPLFAVRTAARGQTHILRDKYAVSILHETTPETVLEALHRNHLQTYTTSTIQNVFDDFHYIYGFVCNQTLLNQILHNRKCTLIIPASLLPKMSIDAIVANMYVDEDC